MERIEASDSERLEKQVLWTRGREWQGLDTDAQTRFVGECFRYWRCRGFPYYSLTDEQIAREYRRLAAVENRRMFLGSEIQMSMVGLAVANYFHPQMWNVRVTEARSPLQIFENDELFKRALRKALSIWPDRNSVNASNLRRILKTFSRTAGVSNFRPTAAKAIYEKYSREGDRVLDFSAGYGGRLVGCLPLDRQYIGIDPCSEQVAGLKRTASKLRELALTFAQVLIIQGCAEDVLETFDSSSVSLVFSSPPYFDHERYSKESSQSYLRYPTYAEWRGSFLARVIQESHRILKLGGYFILNIADVNGHSLVRDASRLACALFQPVTTLQLRLGHKPYRRRNEDDVFKHEPIMVFRRI